MTGVIALFVRSLRQTTRSGGTYLLRAGLALGVLIALISAHIASLFLAAPGLLFFRLVFFLNYFYLVLAGCGFFATAVAEEKEEGTLALLRMTNLNALSILLGKSTSRLCAALLLLTVQLPFVMLGVTIGGVSVLQILSGYALLGLFAFSAANLSLLFSVYFRRVWSASVATLLVIVVCGFIVPVLAPALLRPASADSWILRHPGSYARVEEIVSVVRYVSPVGHLTQITGGSLWQANLAPNAVVHLSLGLSFFAAAWAMFERRSHGVLEVAASHRTGGRHFSFFRPGRAWKYALAWKDFHFQYGGWRALVARSAFYGLLCAGILKWPKLSGVQASQDILATVCLYIAFWFLQVELAIFAALMWSREYWGHTLGSILGLPRSLGNVFREKLRGFALALFPPLAFLTLATLGAGPDWIFRTVRALFVQDNVMPRVFLGLANGSIFGVLRSVCETAFYLVLVVHLSLRLRWAALPAAYGVAMAISIGGSMALLSIVMLLQYTMSGRSLGSGTFLNPATLQSLLMAPLYLIGGAVLVRMTRKLILVRAGES